jgi:hypothetical protein
MGAQSLALVDPAFPVRMPLAPGSAANVKPEHAGSGAGIPSSGYAHRPQAPIPGRYASVDTAI